MQLQKIKNKVEYLQPGDQIYFKNFINDNKKFNKENFNSSNIELKYINDDQVDVDWNIWNKKTGNFF